MKFFLNIVGYFPGPAKSDSFNPIAFSYKFSLGRDPERCYILALLTGSATGPTPGKSRPMRNLTFIALSLPMILFARPPFAAGQPRERRERNLVRVPGLAISETVTVPGFWRPRYRAGYRWVRAARDDVGRWHGGYWEPLHREKEEQVTVPGYWGPPGRLGYIRITTQDRPGDYLAGSWELMNSFEIRRTPREWVPGYWNRRRWVPGYWRQPEKEGYIWVGGYYRTDGRWQEARWEPAPDGKG